MSTLVGKEISEARNGEQNNALDTLIKLRVFNLFFT